MFNCRCRCKVTVLFLSVIVIFGASSVQSDEKILASLKTIQAVTISHEYNGVPKPLIVRDGNEKFFTLVSKNELWVMHRMTPEGEGIRLSELLATYYAEAGNGVLKKVCFKEFKCVGKTPNREDREKFEKIVTKIAGKI